MQINKWNFHQDRGQRPALEATKQASWVARVNSRDSNVLGNHCACAYHYLITHCYWQNSGIRSDTYMVTKFCSPPKLRLPSRSTSKEQVIDKHSAMRDKAVVTDRDEFADERVGLNPTPLTDRCAFLYLNERPDEGVIADVTGV
jgi:hypothetical protein